MKMMVLARDAETYASLLEGKLPEAVTLTVCSRVRDAKSLVGACEVILGQPDLVRWILDDAKRLKWVQSTFAGVDALCQPQFRKNYRLTGLKGIFGPLMSEYVMGHIIAWERRLFDVRENQRQKAWEPFESRSLKDLTIGLLGLGSIGEHVAKTAACFGMRSIGYRRSGRPSSAVEKVFNGDGFHDFLGDSDYVVSTLPATPETKHLVNADAFAAMKRSGVFINAGRGSTLCEADLISALERKEIAGAVLDVFEKEPLPAESPLWEMEEVVITPHTAAISYPKDIVGIFLKNLSAYLAGESLSHEVDLGRGY